MLNIVLRTLFYHWFIIFSFIAVFFLCNLQWATHQSILIKRFFKNAFFPVQWNEKTEQIVKNIGSYRLWLQLDFPIDFEIIEDKVYANQEWYWAKYSYTSKQGIKVFEEKTTRVRWKTWEYYYGFDIDDSL
jgi:hypothetical protein